MEGLSFSSERKKNITFKKKKRKKEKKKIEEKPGELFLRVWSFRHSDVVLKVVQSYTDNIFRWEYIKIENSI